MSYSPSIILDTTLADLYRGDGSSENAEYIALVVYTADRQVERIAHGSLSRTIPQNSIYLFQDWAINASLKYFKYPSCERKARQEKEAQRRRYAAIKYLSLVPRCHVFAAGDMPIILINATRKEQGECTDSENELFRIIGHVEKTQRSEYIISLLKAADFSPRESGINRSAAGMELDELQAFHLTVNLDSLYLLNSKAALYTSGLPTPRCDIIEMHSIPADYRNCCEACLSAAKPHYIPLGCSGSRWRWLSAQALRIKACIARRPLPFVVNLQQTYGGGSSIQIKTSDERHRLYAMDHMLSEFLSKVTSQNAHLRPGTIILRDFIENPIAKVRLTFFLHQNKESRFLALTERPANEEEKPRCMSRISYRAQKKLEKEYKHLEWEIAEWLGFQDYYGVCEVDVLKTATETPPPQVHIRPFRNLHIINLRVRGSSGSLVLGLLKGHFSDKRGLHEAALVSLVMKMPRVYFVNNFKEELAEGRVIVVAWHEGDSYFATLAVAGENREILAELLASVERCAYEMLS